MAIPPNTFAHGDQIWGRERGRGLDGHLVSDRPDGPSRVIPPSQGEGFAWMVWHQHNQEIYAIVVVPGQGPVLSVIDQKGVYSDA